MATRTQGIYAAAAALFLALLAWPGFSAEPANGTDGANQIPQADPYSGLTDVQIDAAKTTIQKIKDEQGVIFPDGDPNGDLWKQVNAKRVQERITFFDRLNEWNGGGSIVAGSPVDGGFLLRGQVVRNPRHFRDDRYLGPSPSFEVVSSNGNLLEDQNRRLNNIANKLSKSKFACGQFDWVLQLRSQFNKAALTKYVDSLGESALAAAPMALLANISPTLYEIVKFMRGLASADLNMQQMKCEQLEAAFTNVGRRTLRGDGYAECIKANQALGVSEAHRICNSESSPFDGIENTAGQIKGFIGESEPISVTKMLSDRVTTGQPSATAADTKGKADADARMAKASADLDANPDPGDANAAWVPGSAEYITWQKKKNNYIYAQKAYAAAQKNVRAAYKDVSDPGVWGRLRNSLSDNLGSIIGNIDMSAKADLQFGNQDQYRLVLFYKHQAFLLAQDFAGQLERHFDVIGQNSRDVDTINQSYAILMGYCFSTAQAPWMQAKAIDLGNNRTSYDVRFSYSTLDKLAILWTKSRRGSEDSVARTIWETEFRTTEAVNLITRYEVYDFLYDHAKRDKPKIIGEAQNMLKQEGADKIIANIENSLNNYMELLAEKREELIPQLAEVIDAVNKFQIDRGIRGYEPSRRATPILPELQQLGR